MRLAPAIRLHTLTASLEQHWQRLGSLPYWGHPWPGGQGLARHVLDHPQLVRGRRVLDVASGSGIAALAAALAGATEVLASDVDPIARTAIALNAEANGVRVDVIATDLLDGDAAGRDVILAGDACYEPELARRVTAFLRRAADSGAVALLGDPGRPHCDPAGFRRLANYAVPTPEGVERGPVTPTTVWLVPGQPRS